MNGPSDDEAVALVHEMVAISSPSGHEAQLAAHLRDRMCELGLAAHIDKTGNVVGTIANGPGPSVMLLGHLDTAGPPLPTWLRDGRLHGTGSVDAKGPLAAMIVAAARATDWPGTLTVIGVVEEETPGSRGAVAVRTTHRQPDAVIVGEPSGWDGVVQGYKGKLDLRYRAQVAPTHPTNPAVKAVEAAAACWADVLTLIGPDASHVHFDQPGATLVRLVGDLVDAELECSVRTPPGFPTGPLLDALTALHGADRITVLNDVPGYLADRRSGVVTSLCTAIRGLEVRPVLRRRSATSDMNTLAVKWSCPMATYGPGESRLDHSVDEHLRIDDYLRAVTVLHGALALLPARLDAP